jgi:hypothetical protein
MDVSELNPEGITLAEGVCDLGGGILAEGLLIGGQDSVPSSITPLNLPYN